MLYSELLGKAQELTARSKHYLGVIRQQADHAANLIRQILDFSRRAMERAPLDLPSLARDGQAAGTDAARKASGWLSGTISVRSSYMATPRGCSRC
ncbi:MAG: hypothetical protein IPO15_27335 [Anaerolineae bacterium]|uniref:histidine kinase dimerization/phospho-acceptor domain-containing protein n=1 Tax=Candidatus Amarolinea dominans TaxID=3140696 RepID=UPI0031374741|nr:hypothetical protein [Anaerolineae bacterium]